MSRLVRNVLLHGMVGIGFILIVACGDDDGETTSNTPDSGTTDTASESNSDNGTASESPKDTEVTSTEDGQNYDPCAGKSCGDTCTLCPPNGTAPCEEDEEVKYCDSEGKCHGSLDESCAGNDTEPCDSLDTDACAKRSDCAHINANPIDGPNQCLLEHEPVGCWPMDYGCDDAIAVAVDADGQCWHFGCLNVPSHMTELDWAEISDKCDADPDQGFPRCEVTCAEDELKTASGCMTCTDAHNAMTEALEMLIQDNIKCENDDECVLASVYTKCYGACPRAISVFSEETFAVELERLSDDFCGDTKHDTLCGYVAPKCTANSAKCVDRMCETVDGL